MSKNCKTYVVQADLKLTVGIEVKAKTLEEALVEARTLKETDFVDILGDYIDGSMEVTGIY